MKRLIKRGFTLIELLAVIVILSIILVIAVPQIFKKIDETKISTFEESAKIIQEHVMVLKVSGAIALEENIKRCITTEEAKELDLNTTDYDIGYDDAGDQLCSTLLLLGETVVVTLVPKEGGKYYGVDKLTYPVVPSPEVCFVFNSTTKTITGYNHTNPLCSSDVVVPNKIANVNVENIGASAFYNKQIKSVVILEGIKTIGNNAFRSNQITSVTLPSTITIIDDWAFRFNQISKLDLRHLTSLITIDYCAFATNIISDLRLPENLVNIGHAAFYYNQLTSITIPPSVTNLEPASFSGNMLSDSTAFIYARNPDGTDNLSKINSYAGARKSDIVIPTNVTTIGTYSFAFDQITNMVIPSNVRIIEDCAFYGTDLTSLIIENGVTTIGYDAFSFNFLPDNQAFIYARNGDGTENNTKVIGYGGAKQSGVVIPNSVTTIGAWSFEYLPITSITIPSTVTVIERGAFYDNRLTSIVLPPNITSIERYTFYTNRLTSVTIPVNVTSIGEYAFYGNLITSVTIPAIVSTIDTGVYTNNPITSVTILGTSTRFNAIWTTIGFPAGLMP